MDPNENLKKQLQLASLILADDTVVDQFFSRADELAYLVISLNQWIINGGSLPDVWLKNPK